MPDAHTARVFEVIHHSRSIADEITPVSICNVITIEFAALQLEVERFGDRGPTSVLSGQDSDGPARAANCSSGGGHKGDRFGLAAVDC